MPDQRARALHEAGRVRQTRVFQIDAFPFAGHGRKFRQILYLPAQLIEFGAARRRMGLMLGKGFGEALPFTKRFRDSGGLPAKTGMIIEQTALRLAAQQRLMRVLPVNIHQ